MGARSVLQRILLEPDAVQADPGKRARIRSAGARRGPELISPGHGDHMQVLERLNPGPKDRRHLRKAPRRQAAKATGAAVVVEVHIELVVLRRLRHGGALSEMLLYIGDRAVDALLLATPQRNANGTRPRLVQ